MTAQHEFILGGQKSGKSRCAELRAARWLEVPGQEAVLLVTAMPWDDEMRARIARHQADRAVRVPRLQVDEVPQALPQAIARWSAPHRLVLVDCLTLWLTQLLMPPPGAEPVDGLTPAQRCDAARVALLQSLVQAAGPVVLVSNEIGLGLSPLSSEARRFVDELGRLHQGVAQACARVTLMVAGCELAVRSAPAGAPGEPPAEWRA